MKTLANNRRQGIIALLLVVLFAWLGMYWGATPFLLDLSNAGSFGAVLRGFALEPQTRSIIVLIIVDVVTGAIAALRVGTFDTQRLAGFMASNVLPYLLGFMLFWFLAYFGFADYLSEPINSAIVSLAFGAVMASLCVSIVDNVLRGKAGTAPPHDALVGNLPPAEPHA